MLYWQSLFVRWFVGGELNLSYNFLIAI
ncbi:hypothetical protein [cyanobacterium endosymbiont of Epithemia turgida]